MRNVVKTVLYKSKVRRTVDRANIVFKKSWRFSEVGLIGKPALCATKT